MKSKNLLLAFVAFTFAIGSAFASLSFLQVAYAEVLLEASDETWECAVVGECEDAGSIQCKINVPYSSAGGGNKVIDVDQPGCATRLLQNTDNFGIPTDSFFDVRTPTHD